MISGAVSFVLVALVIGSAVFYSKPHADKDSPIDSVAVLPVVANSSDQNAQFLSDGITDSLIDRLSQVPNLKVMSRSSVFHYKGREVDPQAVGRELNVKACVSTSTAITSTLNLNKTTIYDGLGRATQTQLTSDPGGVDYVDKTYDALGRKATVSNPHRTASSSTDGITTYGYDALDRVMKCLCRKICQWTRVTS